jgi:hypothetical protein
MSNYYNRQWRLPNAWNGTESNVNKQSNYSLSFDGSSQYIDTNSTFNTLTSFSISAWFKADDTAGVVRSIVSTRDHGLLNSQGLDIYINGNVLTGRVYSNGVTEVTQSFTDTTNWHHVALTYNGSTLEFFLDGSSLGTATGSYDNTSGKNLLIGKWGYSSYYFDGQIDGVSIFNYALTDGTGGTVNQIAALYGSSSTGIGNPMSLSPKPVAYYPLGDQDSFNGSSYLTPNASLKDFVFDFIPNDYIDCGNDSSLQITGNITLSTWVNIGTSTSTMRFINKDDGSNRAWIMLVVSGKIRFTRFYTASSFYYMDSSISVNDSNWHHIACVNDSAGTAKIYIDGSEDTATTGTNTGTLLNNASVSLKLGGDFSSQYLNGKLSNTQIFNTALPATGSNSVETLYNNGSPLTSMSGFTSLQGWWKLNASDTYDSSTGNWTIEDHAGSNDGTSSGMTQANLVQSDLSFTSGYSPYALDFDGTNDYIGLGNDSSLRITTAMTISCWIKTTNSGNNTIIGRELGSGTGRDWKLYLNNGNVLFWCSADGTAGDITVLTSSSTVNDGNWHNLIAVNDGTNQYIYIDGNLNNSNSGGQTINASTTNNYIGSKNGNTFFFNGSISNVSIWNAGLTSAQVTEIYNEGVPSNLNNHSAYSNLVSWWQLGSNSSFNTNWTVLDEKGSNNGTSVNMTEDDIVDGVGSYANGLSSGMGGDEVIGDAPYSTANALSVNMDALDRVEDTPS